MRTSSAARRFGTWAPLAVMLIVLLPAVSAAQEPVKSFDQLNTRLRVGDTVWVTDAQGREVKGKIASLGVDALALDAGGTKLFSASDVRRVEEPRSDSLLNGAIIGAIPGALLGLTMGNFSGEWRGGDAAVGALICGGIGAGIGLGIDALITGQKQVVYRAPGVSGSARLSLMPVLTPGAKGVAVSFSF